MKKYTALWKNEDIVFSGNKANVYPGKATKNEQNITYKVDVPQIFQPNFNGILSTL